MRRLTLLCGLMLAVPLHAVAAPVITSLDERPEGGETRVVPSVAGPSDERVLGTVGGQDNASTSGTVTTFYLPGGVPLEMVSIPPGTFQMGANENDVGWQNSDEEPEHMVSIPYEFQMGRFEVTQRQWLAVMNRWPGSPDKAPSSEYGRGDDFPAYYVSWSDIRDANGFLERLNQHIASTGQGTANFRLPSEAEWEYACRAGSQWRFSFGNSNCSGPVDCTTGRDLADYAWYCGNKGASGTPTYGSKPVGGKLPNAFGLYDMHGNVAEWCEDRYHWTYNGAPADGSAWVTDGYTDRRLDRGGSWRFVPSACYSACRSHTYQYARDYEYIGFRLSRTLFEEPFTFSLSPPSTTIPSAGGTGFSVSVTAGPGCSWNALPNHGWVTITSGSSGNGNGTVTYRVWPNTKPSERTATITVQGQTHTITQSGGTELALVSADFGPEAPVAVQPGSQLNCSWRVQGLPSQFWCEFLLSKTGGFDIWRGGATLTGSSFWNFGGGDSTHSPSNQMVNWIPDGIYTVVGMVNRPGTGSFAERYYRNNWAPIAGKRILIRNTQAANCDLEWVAEPTWNISGTDVTLSGTLRNAGPQATPAYGFWIETMHGVFTPELLFAPNGYIGGGYRVTGSIPPNGTVDFTQSGTAPAGSLLLVVLDSTDIVPETDERDNWQAWLTEYPSGRGTADVQVVSAEISPTHLAPNTLSSFGSLQWSATLRNWKATPTGDFWIELFHSTTGGAILPNSGITLTQSQKISLAASETRTFTFDQPFNRITDGIYSVVVIANRNSVPQNPGDENPWDNAYAMPGRIVLTNPATPAANLAWSSGPTVTGSGNGITVQGSVRNYGTAASGPFWTEAFFGYYDSAGQFQKVGQVAGGVHNPGLDANAEAPVSISGAVPNGYYDIGLCTDSTDLVPETDETDNYKYVQP